MIILHRLKDTLILKLSNLNRFIISLSKMKKNRHHSVILKNIKMLKNLRNQYSINSNLKSTLSCKIWPCRSQRIHNQLLNQLKNKNSAVNNLKMKYKHIRVKQILHSLRGGVQ